MVAYNYGLAQLEWVTDDSGSRWQCPYRGFTDFRALPDQAMAGTFGSFPWVFCWHDGPLGAEAVTLASGDCRDITATTAMRDAWEAKFGYRPTGDKLVDLAWDQYTNGAVYDGSEPAKPIVPNHLRQLNLIFPGHSVVKQVKRFRLTDYDPSSGYGNVLLSLIRDDLKRTRVEAKSGLINTPVVNERGIAIGTKRGDTEAHQKKLKWYTEKYRIRTDNDDWQVLLPAVRDWPRREGPRPHNTDVSDDFNRPDESLDAGSWSEDIGNWSVVSNEIKDVEPTTADIYAHYTTSLSSNDNQATIDFVGRSLATGWFGPDCRVNAAGTTFYQGYDIVGGANSRLAKVVTGTYTNLATGVISGSSFPITCKTEASGTDISFYSAATLRFNVTDSAISTGTYLGVASRGGNRLCRGDNLSGGDLAATPTGGPFPHFIRRSNSLNGGLSAL